MLHETDDELSRSRRVLRRMATVTIHNKIILTLIIIVQVWAKMISRQRPAGLFLFLDEAEQFPGKGMLKPRTQED
jgi:hypothetical protein